MQPKQGSIDYTTTRLYTNLENLFNGDKLLGKDLQDKCLLGSEGIKLTILSL